MVELAGEVADGALLLVGLHPKAIAAARLCLEAGARRAGRDLRQFTQVFVTPMALDDGSGDARRWPQRWLTKGHPWITYPSVSNLHWLREAGLDLPDDVSPAQVTDQMSERICDAFGLFGTAEECAQRLERAVREAGIDHVFIFPAHTLESGYDMPDRDMEAFRDVIFPALSRRAVIT
jgi:5,10-methylenetetrahydromethanopterin reductase